MSTEPRIKTRLYCPEAILESGLLVTVPEKQAHYLRSVMRLSVGDNVGIFNGHDGEYACQITKIDKKSILLCIQDKIRDHLPPSHIGLAFAVIKKTPLEYLVQKATELGVGFLQPLITDRTVIRDINHERLKAIAIEAAEQCGLTAIPKVEQLMKLNDFISQKPKILFCDERGQGLAIKEFIKSDTKIDYILIGPEGGFSEIEASKLYDCNYAYAVGLGSRIMRAETAAIAALSVLQLG